MLRSKFNEEIYAYKNKVETLGIYIKIVCQIQQIYWNNQIRKSVFFDIKNRIKRKETVLNLIKIYNKYKLEYDDLTYINPKRYWETNYLLIKSKEKYALEMLTRMRLVYKTYKKHVGK